MTTSRLFAIIQEHERRWGVKPAEVARRMGVTPQTVYKWKRPGKALPDQENLKALARVTGRPYIEVLTAALTDAAYVTDPGAVDRELKIHLSEGEAAPAATDATPTSGATINVRVGEVPYEMTVTRADGKPTQPSDLLAAQDRMDKEAVFRAMLEVFLRMDPEELAKTLAEEDDIVRVGLTNLYVLMHNGQEADEAGHDDGSRTRPPAMSLNAGGSEMRGSA